MDSPMDSRTENAVVADRIGSTPDHPFRRAAATAQDRRGGVRRVARSLALAAGLAAAGVSGAAEHPTLVDPAATSCVTCHDEVLAVPVLHAPAADDCLTCHLFERSGDSTEVSLAASGSDLCVTCHDSMDRAARGELEAPHAPVVGDCVGCHDPHGAELEALLVSSPSSLCFDCHDADATDAVHQIPVRRADCRSCHAVHGSNQDHMLRGGTLHMPFAEGSCEACHRKPRGTRVRLLQDGGALCEACHGDVAAPESGRVIHTAVRQGRCVACHDPHLAERANLLKAGGGELCFSCHPEIAERALGPGAHQALEDGCDSCHAAHHSDRRDLLTAAEDELCRTCHDVEDPELVRLHFGADLSTTKCGSCHDPHGSTSKPLIANGSIHAPFREGCSTCHDGTAQRLVDEPNALCGTCHDDVVSAAADAAVPHPAMEMVECVDCHSPHASRQRSLLSSSGGGPCVTCHEDQAGAEGEVVHRAITWIGCQSCHMPHGGERESLLRASGNDLCTGCHLEGEVRTEADGSVILQGGWRLEGERAAELEVIDLDPLGRVNHPIPGHPVAGPIDGRGRTEVAPSLVGREMSCRLCHEPHAANSPGLFAWQAQSRSELCLACHPK